MKTDLFQSCGHCWVFHICWHIGCSTFPASSFRIWNSSTGIPSPPLALFVVMLPKAHLTSHSRMSGSRWVITPLWLSEHLFCVVLLCVLANSYLGYLQVALVVKNLPANVGDKRDMGSIPGLGRSSGEGNGNPLQYSCLENPMDTGAWRAAVWGAAKSQTWLKWLSTNTSTSTPFFCYYKQYWSDHFILPCQYAYCMHF